MRKETIKKTKVTFNNVEELYDFIRYNGEASAFYVDCENKYLPLSTSTNADGDEEVLYSEGTITNDDLDYVIGFKEVEKAETEIVKTTKHSYLLLPDNTCVSILLTGEVPVYWIAEKVEEVKDAQTIYGGCPHRFGIRID